MNLKSNKERTQTKNKISKNHKFMNKISAKTFENFAAEERGKKYELITKGIILATLKEEIKFYEDEIDVLKKN